jgi:hypothetical protein
MTNEFKADFSRLSFADLYAILDYSANASQTYEEHFDQNKTMEEQDALAAIFSHAAHATAGELERRILVKFTMPVVKADPHQAKANTDAERFGDYLAS